MNIRVDCSIHCRKWFILYSYKICCNISTLISKSKEIVISKIIIAPWRIEIYYLKLVSFAQCVICTFLIAVTSLLSLYSTNNISTKEFSRVTALSLLHQIAYSFLSIEVIIHDNISKWNLDHKFSCQNGTSHKMS